MRDVLNVLFRRRWLVLGFFAATLAGGFAALKLVSPTYEATARLLVRIGHEDLYMPVLPTSQFRAPVMSVVREEQLRTESSLLTDASLARRVVQDLTPQRLFPGIDVRHPWYTPKGLLQQLNDLYQALENYFFPFSAQRTLEDRAVAAFERALKAEAIKSANTIELSMRNKSPQAAALGVNTLIKHYLQERVRLFQHEQAAFFEQQLARLNDSIREAESLLEQQRTQGRVLDLDKQRTAQVDNLNDTRRKLDDARVSIAQLERRQQVLRQQLAGVPATMQVTGAESTNAQAVSEIGRQVAEIRRSEVDIAQRFSAADPRLAVLREQRNALQALLDDQQQRRVSTASQGVDPVHARLRDESLQVEVSLAAARQTAGQLQALERDITARVGQYNAQDPAYRQSAQRLQVLRETRQLYLEKAEEARLMASQAGSQNGNVAVVSYAEQNLQPVSPKLWLVLLGVLLGGLAGGIGLAFAAEWFDNSLRSESDVQRALGLPLLARVPEQT